jgi:DNA primase
MKRYAPRVVLAFDADAAGQNAAERFYEWERKYEVDVAVAALPRGVDPGDLAQRDPEALKVAVDEAVPFLRFRVQRVLSAADLASPEGRARAAEQALAVIREHPSDLVRDQYVVEVADATRNDPDRLRAALDRPGREAAQPALTSSPGRRLRPRTDPESEVEALRLMAHRREEAEPELHEVLFASERTHAAFLALAAGSSLRDAIDRADPGAAELLSQVVVEEPEADVVDVVSRLIEARIDEAAAEIEAGARTLDTKDDGWAHLAEERAWLATERMRLRAQQTDGEERGELVAFLVERSERPGPPADASPAEPPEVEQLVENEPAVDDAPPPEEPGEEIA